MKLILLLLGLLIVSPSAFAAVTMKLNGVNDFYVGHGQASQQLTNSKGNPWQILAKASAESPDPYWFVSLTTPLTQTDYLSQNYTGAKGSYRWELENNVGATTASGNLQVAPGVAVLIQLGLHATTDTFDTTDPDNPKLELTAANYNGGNIHLTLNGKVTPGRFCVGATNVSDTHPNCGEIYTFGGNGQHNWKYNISIIEQGAEMLPTNSGVSGGLF